LHFEFPGTVYWALFDELWKAQQGEDASDENAEPDAGGDKAAQPPPTKNASVRKPLP
jgi:hypothetical protein